ncbi:hypothetical protein GJ700_30250 [Duganella sp. FT92W]|uniref:Uncharacterized protein n=1 Tax=Pseudoduganella rivuli TaxID=2666085 RepID=A0A7X2LXJ9_9BURK|nr:hypothetical protein [Pseudoduganella rivuli]MRV76004.1 hypothetical protein [Pseudoduganella rivuli]
MIPSPLAALAYATVKIAGYSLFAHQLNRFSEVSVSPIRFGFAKTGIGFIGGLLYFAVLAWWHPEHVSDTAIFVGAIPIRFLAWAIALSIFYGFRRNTRLINATLFVGVFWSYILDGVMWAIYQVLPGMVMPFC